MHHLTDSQINSTSFLGSELKPWTSVAPTWPQNLPGRPYFLIWLGSHMQFPCPAADISQELRSPHCRLIVDMSNSKCSHFLPYVGITPKICMCATSDSSRHSDLVMPVMLLRNTDFSVFFQSWSSSKGVKMNSLPTMQINLSLQRLCSHTRWDLLFRVMNGTDSTSAELAHLSGWFVYSVGSEL